MTPTHTASGVAITTDPFEGSAEVDRSGYAMNAGTGTGGYVVYVTNDPNVQSEVDFCRHIVNPGIVPSGFEAAKYAIKECRFGMLGKAIIVEVFPHVGSEFRFRYETTLTQVER